MRYPPDRSAAMGGRGFPQGRGSPGANVPVTGGSGGATMIWQERGGGVFEAGPVTPIPVVIVGGMAPTPVLAVATPLSTPTSTNPLAGLDP